MKRYLGPLLLIIVLAVACVWVLKACTDATARTVAEVKNAFGEVLHVQPQVTVNSRVVLTQTAPIAELAVASKQELVTLGFVQHLEFLSYQIPMTQKSLKAEATYEVKAGFDLRHPINVTVDPLTGHVRAALPHATILSVTQMGELSLQGEDAALNRVTDEERSKLLNDLSALARAQADSSSLKGDAEKQVVQRLQEILSHNGKGISAVWDSDDHPSAP